MPALYLSHAVAAALLVVGARLPRRARSRWAVIVALVGAVAGAGLAIASDGQWRTTTMAPEIGRLIGAGIACAWLLTAVLGPAGERWRTGAYVGVASTGLCL